MMRGGNATIGTWLQFPSADVAEVMGASGYDWVAVDMEHGAFTRAILPDVFRAIERGGSTPFARIAQAELRPIKDALDSGAQEMLMYYVGGMVVLAALGALCTRHRIRLMDTAGRKALATLREDLFNHIEGLSF